MLLGTSAASTLERLVDSLRRAPAAPPRAANTAGAAAASSTTGAPSRDDARTPDGAEPQAAAAIPEAGPPAQPPPDERGPRLALSHAEDDSAARPAQAPRTPPQPRPTSLQPHGRNWMASICKPSSQSGCPLCRACRHFCGPAYGKPTPTHSEPCVMHTREPAKSNKPELGNCSYLSRACFSAAHGLRAQPDARRCSNECATSLPGAGLLCSQQHAMLQTSTALPQQPMPTMMTLRASAAGRPPARTSAEEKCPEAGPCLQRRLWLRAPKTPSQHCPTRPGAHLPCSLQSPQTCATSNLTRRPHSQMPPSVRLCVPPGAGPLPAYQARRASTTKFCSTTLKPSSCSRMLRTCSPQRKSPPTSLLHLPFPALQRCVSLPAGCVGSLYWRHVPQARVAMLGTPICRHV